MVERNEKREMRMEEYWYDLPSERVAEAPSRQRSESRLLRYDAEEDRIEDRRFSDLPELIPPASLLLMNDTRVVPARLQMQRATGGAVEVFLVDPVTPSDDPAITLASGRPTRWTCMVRGLKRVKTGEILTISTRGGKGVRAEIELEAELIERSDRNALLEFRWKPQSDPFSTVLETVGRVPLPPYIDRPEREEDREEYQTVYARHDGAVAAPTAGLHFTPELLEELEQSGINVAKTTLHVGAGTFAPVTSEHVADHTMHAERFEVSRDTLVLLARCLSGGTARSPIVQVGTTTVRTLESIYWIAEDLMRRGEELSPHHNYLPQWHALERGADNVDLVTPADAFGWVVSQLEVMGESHLRGSTQLMILPGYRFMTCDHLITNFHQPGSTLILLVAAFLGGERWRNVYAHALENDYRFLSFGDASFLTPPATGT